MIGHISHVFIIVIRLQQEVDIVPFVLESVKTFMSGYPILKGILQNSKSYTWNTADSLGRGATAVVYLGREKSSGNVVAVKVFHEHIRFGSGGEDLRELELLRRLNHENIIQLHDIEQELQTKRLVLIMEYCEGGSLYHMLDQPPYQYGLPEEQFLLVLFHVAAGIQYLRRSGVVHRDIKPGNIMRYLKEDGKSLYKLTDFGAARTLGDEENFTSLYGTEEYLHPGLYEKAVLRRNSEQHRFDAKVDLWSLGVTFYHVATGQLPFQPYGGRNNRDTMFRIITQKESGIISGQQHFENGPIHWSRELPSTCQLSSGLCTIITPMLAGLMEPDPSRMLTYETFFNYIDRLKEKMKLLLFNCISCSQIIMYIDPHCTLAGLQDAVASMTELPASQQLLLLGGYALDEIIDPVTTVSDFPTHIKTSTIFLFPRETLSNEPQRLSLPDIPPYPEFLNIIDVEKDARLALNCMARGHLIKHHTQNTMQYQDLVIQGHLLLRIYVESRLKTTGQSLQQMQQLVVESRKRFNSFYTMVDTVGQLTSRKDPLRAYCDEITCDQTLRKVHIKAEERAEEIQKYRNALNEKLNESRSHPSELQNHCGTQACSSKVEHHLTVITNIQNRFRRDKSVKSQMTTHDENIHKFERQKLQDHCLKMLSILTGHCLPSRDALYKQVFPFLNMLIKALGRVIKVEKNIESVINCQQLLSTRLDKIELKCQELITHTQLMRIQQHFEIDPRESGLGTSASHNSFSGGGTDVQSSISSDATDRSIVNEFQSLRTESEQLRHLLEQNFEIIKRLEEDSMNMQSSGSLSRMSAT